MDSQISTQMETGDDLELLCAIIIIVETSGYSKARRIETNIVDHDPSTSDQSEKVGQSKEKQTENPKTSSIRCGPDQRSCIFSGYDSVKQNEKTMQDLTGVRAAVFSLLLTLLPNERNSTQVSRVNRLLMFMMKMKIELPTQFWAVYLMFLRRPPVTYLPKYSSYCTTKLWTGYCSLQSVK